MKITKTRGRLPLVIGLHSAGYCNFNNDPGMQIRVGNYQVFFRLSELKVLQTEIEDAISIAKEQGYN